MDIVNRLALMYCGLLVSACAGTVDEDTAGKPEIIEVFACSDYCPGPEKKYLKKVYKGVEDADECRALGGKPYTYIGWGQHFICKVR